MSKELQAQFALQVIWSEDQIGNVAPNYEPWLVVDKTADLIPVIEDELLLALPIVNYHKPGDCWEMLFSKTKLRRGMRQVLKVLLVYYSN